MIISDLDKDKHQGGDETQTKLDKLTQSLEEQFNEIKVIKKALEEIKKNNKEHITRLLKDTIAIAKHLNVHEKKTDDKKKDEKQPPAHGGDADEHVQAEEEGEGDEGQE